MSYRQPMGYYHAPVRRRRRTALSGFGQAEEAIEEVVEEAAPPARTGLKMAVTVGAVGVLGLGLWFGFTKRTVSGSRRYRFAV